MILLVGLLAGLGGRFGLAFLWENLDTSFKRSDEIPGFPSERWQWALCACEFSLRCTSEVS